jgi:hypothetical protein
MIRETIITTVSAAGQVHIAPMGIREQQQGLTVLAPFRPSTTLDNVTATGVAVINYCDDVRIFAGCLTGRRDWPLVPATAVKCMRLKAALAHDELQLERTEHDALRPRLLCRVAHRANHKPFHGFNRAQAAVIEAAVLVSRLDLLPHEKIDSEIAYLTIAIDKTAGDAEREAWGWLLQKIAAHRAETAERPT